MPQSRKTKNCNKQAWLLIYLLDLDPSKIGFNNNGIPLYRFLLDWCDLNIHGLLQDKSQDTRLRIQKSLALLRGKANQKKQRQSDDASPKCRCGNTPRQSSISDDSSIWEVPICRECKEYPMVCQECNEGLHEHDLYHLQGVCYHTWCAPKCHNCDLLLPKCMCGYSCNVCY